ncbi:MAG: prolyl oligopeptidase family serine peptidase [Phycisphaerales bacterium]
MMTLRTRLGLLLTLILAFHTPLAGAQSSIPLEDKPLQIEGRLPTAAYITRTQNPVPEDLSEVEMLRDRLGLIDIIEPKGFTSINRLARPSDEEPSENPALFLQIARNDSTICLGLDVLEDTVLLSTLDEPRSVWSIRRAAFERLGITVTPSEMNRQSDGFAPTNAAMEMVLPTPHTESSVVFDPQMIRSRFKMQYPRLTRVLGQETFRVRLPMKYDPGTPAGVLVWISPTPDGRIPDIFGPVCDQLGLIAIGVDNNGNQREITDRLQNHLDSIETLAQHASIDRQRIYLTGMSGGGRCSGILLLAFPDLFAGAVPIVGLDTYHNAPTGDPGKYWPKRLSRPAGPLRKQLEQRRIRSITGTADFNEPEMVLRTQLLQDDGVNAQIDVIEGMAHTMPNAEQFTKALAWVDDPRSRAIEDATNQAQLIMTETNTQDATIPAVRRRLIEVMRLVPDSDLAWEAAKRLGIKRDA